MPLMDEMKTSHAPSFTVGGIEPTAPREVQEEEAEEAEGEEEESRKLQQGFGNNFAVCC